MKRLFKNSVIVILLFGMSIYLLSCKKEATLPIVTTTKVTDITQTTAVTGGTVMDDGGAAVINRGVTWSTAHNPTIGYVNTRDGVGTGTFLSKLSGLGGSTTYYVRAFATNSIGTGYGNEVSFKSNEISLATVTTTNVTVITSTTAAGGGKIPSNGGATITEWGVCWSTSQNPTIADQAIRMKIDLEEGIVADTTFTDILTGLTPGTTYFIRAYAVNSLGTSYGNQVSFFTNQIEVATLTTTVISSITSTTAVSGGNITTDGGIPVTVRGVCWGTAADPTINDNNTNNGSGTGNFNSNLTGLNPGTTYFVRAYAVNGAGGLAYGNQVTFSTPLREPIGRKADYPGEALYNSTGFSIGTKIYIGLGFNSDDNFVIDFWEWDQTTDVWTKKADFPGSLTTDYLCFSIGSKGYIVTGNHISNARSINDLWEYDPAADSWTLKAFIPTTPARSSAVGFSIGNKGYIGTGSDGSANSKDFWEWDQSTNVWTRKADFPGNTRVSAVGFSIGNKGYIGTGSDGSANSKDFWEWDQSTNLWTRKADFPGNTRVSAVGFSIGNKGYIGTGSDGSTNFKDFWEWDQTTDVWIKKADFEGNARLDAVGFSIGNKGYIGMGWDSTSNLRDLWEYDPNLK